MRFKDIKQYVRFGSWQCAFDLISFHESIERYEKRDGLVINPDFQRGVIWTEEQQSAWLEFILRGGQTGNVIYLNDNVDCGERVHPDGRLFVCVDGLQRITAIKRFMNNEIRAFGHFFNEYEDRPSVTTHPLYINKNNLNTRAEIIEWYLHMNSGGIPHSADELNRVARLLEEARRNRENLS